MFNFFRRKRGSIEPFEVDNPEIMPSDEDACIMKPDENQNVETVCVIRGQGDDGECKELGLIAKHQPEVELQQVQEQKNIKKVRWADIEMPPEDNSDHSSEESSSCDEEVSEEEDSEEDYERIPEAQQEDEEEKEDETNIVLQEDSARNEEINQLKNQLAQLDRDMTAKSALIDRLQTELKEAYQDSEMAKYKMTSLQEELEQTKKVDNTQMDQSSSSDSDSEDEEEKRRTEDRLREAQERISQLEEQLEQVRREKQEIENNLIKLEQDKQQEINVLQKAYEEALKEQDEMMAKFEEDFEELRTLNSRREQQLLEDFEWKLREVEKSCKVRTEKKEKEKDKEIADLVCKLAESNIQLQEANKLQACKAELDQTKTTNIELKRNLRTTNRRLEEVQVNEKVLQEEMSRLRTSLEKEKSFTTNLQMVHREELDERERKMSFRLDVQKTQIISDWEEKLRKEVKHTKLEMERKAREETWQAVNDIRKQMDEKIKNIKNDHEDKTKQLNAQLEQQKKRLNEKEVNHKESLENVQTKSDIELMDIRRKMEKLYMNYEEKIEKLNEQHEQQISRLQEECDRKIQQIESNLQMQTGTTRATVELVKEQLHRENQVKLQQLENQHQRQLEEQWCRMNKDKEDALKSQENKYREIMKRLQLDADLTKTNTRHKLERDDTDAGSNQLFTSTNTNLQKFQNMSTTSPSVDRPNAQQSIRAELGEAEANLVREKERLEELTLKAKMCQTIQQLTVQLEASKREIESLNSKLRGRLGNHSGNGDIQHAPPQVAKVTPHIAKEPPQMPPQVAKIQPQEPLQVAKESPQVAKVPPQTPPTKTQQQANAQTQQPGNNNQSRGRHRKNRSRRH